MVKTNIQTFTGEVEILSNLHLGDGSYYMTANADASNVIQVTGNVGATFFVGDGGFLSNIATTLSDIVDQGNTVSNVVQFSSDAGVADYKGVGLVTDSNVGIQNTSPDHTLAIGDKIRVDDNTIEAQGQSVIEVDGRILATRFQGDGGLLSNIATTLESIVNQGNVSANVVQFNSDTDYAGAGIITRSNVGIQNTDPVFNLSVGSNLHVDDEGSNVLVVHGNVAMSNLNLGQFTITPSYGLNDVTNTSNGTSNVVQFQNATTSLVATSNITVGGNVTALQLISTSNTEVGDRLKFSGSNVFIDTLRVADVAANLVTYDRTTGELTDSGGTFLNKFAIVSEQPPSDFFANTTTVTNHGTYTLTTSNLATNSNTFNAFDGTANAWVSGGLEGGYIGGSNVFHETNLTQLSNLHPTQFGDWLAIEFPYKTTLRHMKITPLSAAQFPASANVYATNNDLTWTEVKYWKDVVPASDTAVQTITVDATEQFKKYALVATKAAGNSSNVAIQDWQLFTESFSIDGGKVAMATSAVMGGETTMDQHGPHGRGAVVLKKYPEIVFDASKLDGNDTTNTYVQAGYTVTASSQSSGAEVWRLFDDGYGAGSYWNQENVNKYPSPAYTYSPPSNSQSLGGTSGEWFKLELPQKIIVNKIEINAGNNVNYAPLDFKIIGSNNDTDWTVVKDVNGLTTSSYSSVAPFTTTIESVSSVAYKYYAIVFTRLYTATQVSLHEIKFYGYEEDPPAGDSSLDTTFTSVMNTPQTTGAQVYVDGSLGETFTNRVTGPTPTGTATTYDSTGKYWELNGELTSNVTLEANTFLEGDQPHAVSVWFNSSNLEANVSNTCVFSVSDQEHLNSQNLDLQSNTWHNLTYVYQGEGGSRVTYLDGRKVSEDQAEDTFGDYPPFAMTGYSQGGYVVSANHEYDQGAGNLQLLSWKAFDNTTGTRWDTAGNSNYDANGNHNGSVTTTVNGTPESGDWIQIEFPHKIKISYFTLNTNIGSSPINYQQRAPKTVLLAGSNNGTDWVSLFNNTSNPRTSEPSTTLVEPFVVSSTASYKYLRLIVLKTFGGQGTVTSISELSYYGHRENDLVRLPDPTNVLKYPHIAMTGTNTVTTTIDAQGYHAQRNYVLTSSSGDAWNAFDNPENGTYWGTYGANSDSGVPAGSTTYRNGTTPANSGLARTGFAREVTTDTNGDSHTGSWVDMETPNKLKVSSFKVHFGNVGYHPHSPTNYRLFGRNSTSDTWVKLFTIDGAYPNGTTPPQTGGTDKSLHAVGSTVFYKYHRWVCTKLHSTASDGTSLNNNAGIARVMLVRGIEFYGTEEASPVPIQIGGGNIDKVANFRVYDKFIDENQALEIWDAQKDEFGRAKSSMTLHKGRLGIGTTEPEGRLAVLDEPHNLEEFPPRAMTDYETYMEGHGVFKASASTEQNTTTTLGWHVFAKVRDDINKRWRSNSSVYDNTVSPATTTSATATFDGIGVRGEWILLEMPYNVCLKRYEFIGFTGQTPHTGQIWGSDDNGTTWHHVDTFQNAVGSLPSTYPNITNTFHVLGNTKYYSKYVFIVEKLTTADDAASMSSLKYFGTREQGQSVLHDGQLTLTKNLNVPRIGPVFGEYPTPRRNDLLLEYNTALSIHSGDHVIDTSGNSNDGNFNGDATYSEGNRAFEFDGSGDWIYPDSVIVNPAGAWPHSFSMWINTRVNNLGTFFSLGVESSHQSSTVIINSSSVIKWFFYTNDASFNLPNGLTIDGSGSTWYHFAGIYNGGSDSTSRRMWMNGQELTVANPSSSFSSLNIATNTSLRIGIRKNGSQGFNGFISNFRLYNCVLTPNEIFTLYKQGRVPPVHHLQLIDSTMTIGPHSRDPGAHLDVAGHIRAGSQTIHTFTGQHRCFPDEPVEKGLIVSAKKNRFVKLNGFATGQEAITIDESLPIVSLSNVAEDKACFGVVSSIEKPTPKRTQVTNGIISDSKKERGDNRAIVNSVGEGAIWVVNTGGPLESGDYITTSNVVGYGQKQEDDVLHNYTVAKITMDCDFTGSNVAVQTIKREQTGLQTITEDTWNELVDYDRSSNTETQYSNTLVPSAYSNLEVTDRSGYVPREVTTIVDYTDGSNLISIAEWSNLESNIQNTYQSNTFTEIVDYTKFVSLDEWSNLTTDVQNTYSEAEITTYYQIKRGENVLDENGQLQWEDKTGATETPYERRFLDASGAQTDEANAVHIAAFVGCTYHCG